MPPEIRDVAGLSQPLTKLLEVICAGVGKIYEPTHIRRIALAKADEMRLLESARNELDVVRAKQLAAVPNEILPFLPNVPQEVLERAYTRLANQEVQRQLNLDSVIQQAVREMPLDVDAKSVDQDWIARFFQAAQDVSESDMHGLWGKVLAGETSSPGRFPLRSLDILKSLTKDEAVLFEKACCMVSGANDYILKIPTAEKHYIEVYNDEELGRFGLNFDAILRLVDCGLVHSNIELSRVFPVERPLKIYNNGSVVLFTFDGTYVKKELALGAYNFTLAGRALGTLISNNFNTEYFEVLASRYRSRGVLLTVELDEPPTA